MKFFPVLPCCLLIACIFLTCEPESGEDVSPGGDGDKTEAADDSKDAKAVPVRVRKLETSTIVNSVEASGSIFSDRDVTLVSETSGRIVANNLALGKNVKKGETLVAVDSEVYRIAVQSAEAGISQARAQGELAELEFDRIKSLHETGDTSDSAFDQVRLAKDQAQAGLKNAEAALANAKRSLRLSSVRAPFKGEIAGKLVKTGDMLGPGVPIAILVDRSDIKIAAGVGEDAISGVKVGTKARVVIPTLRPEPFGARVTNVGVKALKPTMTYPVELAFADAEITKEIRVGMVARVELEIAEAIEAIMIDMDILTERFDRFYVYLVDGDKAIERKVELGIKVGKQVMLTGGVKEGEIIVISGQANLKDGASIRVVE